MGTAYLISKHKGITEDIVQEAFLQCYKQIKNLKNPDAFDVWFYKLLVRLAWKMSSKHKDTIPIEDINYKNFSSKAHQDFGETRMLVHEAIDKLSPPLKTVIILYYFNDMTVNEISKVLGCFQGTVKSRLHNGRKQLKKALGEYDHNEVNKTMYMTKGCKTNGL